MKKYRVIGVMSGTSLDGLDIALCEFDKSNDYWKSKICQAETIPYQKEWTDKLWNAYHLSGYDLIKLDREFGHFIGTQIKLFIKNHKNKIDFISSHGHTVFHNPNDRVTFQIGSGAVIAATTCITTVSNFRALDVALKGQGAPLVPIGDMQLFNEYDYCLNMGGFANVSFNWYRKRLAYDICPVNFIINHLAKQLHMEFDKDGLEAKKGVFQDKLYKLLNKLPYYSLSSPKSLGREWVENQFIPILDKFQCNTHDKLRTVYEHIAFQLSRSFTGSGAKKIFITGGGAHNKYLIDLLKKRIDHKIIIPDELTINYKEAFVYAFLGVLRMREENNCLSSVTGATHDSMGGIVYRI
jgi:anhydro-N-acetylmuramic acid kinase